MRGNGLRRPVNHSESFDHEKTVLSFRDRSRSWVSLLSFALATAAAAEPRDGPPKGESRNVEGTRGGVLKGAAVRARVTDPKRGTA